MFDCTFRHMCTISWFVCVAWFGTQCSLIRLLLQYSVLPICDLTGTSLTLLKASGSESSQRRASAELLPEPKGPTQAPSAWPRGKALGLVACKGCHHPKLKSNVLATSWHTSLQSASFNVGTHRLARWHSDSLFFTLNRVCTFGNHPFASLLGCGHAAITILVHKTQKSH